MNCKYKVNIKDIHYNYKVKMEEIQSKYKFNIFCRGYDDSDIKGKIDDMYNAWPKVTGEGEEITLNDTVNASMPLGLKGNTYQDSTTGKQLFNYASTNYVENGSTTLTGTGEDFTISTSQDLSLRAYYVCKIDFPTLYAYMSSTYKNGSIALYITNSNSYNNWSGFRDDRTQIQNNWDITQTNSKDLSSYQGKYLWITLRGSYSDGGYSSVNYKDFILSKEQVSAYEPYTNGASPNPDYPQPVHVVSGDNTIKVSGVNLFDKDSATYKNNYYLNGSGVETYYDSAGYTTSFTPVKPNTTYTLSGTIGQGGLVRVYFFDKSKNWIDRTGAYNIPPFATFTTPNNCYYIGLQYAKSTFNASTVMINEGSTALPYEPYQSQSYHITLPEGMFLANIPNTDYQDYFYKQDKKWYKYGAIGKLVLDNSTWQYRLALVSGTTNLFMLNNAIINGKYLVQNAYSTHFINVVDSRITDNSKANSYLGDKQFSFRYGTSASMDRLYLKNTKFDNANDFNDWLVINKPEFLFVLSSPEITEITDPTLISQLEALLEAESYTGQTNISQTNEDMPFIITASTLKDLSNL